MGQYHRRSGPGAPSGVVGGVRPHHPADHLVDLLVESGLATSKGAARRTVAEGGAYVNNAKIADPDWVPATEDLLHGQCSYSAGANVTPPGSTLRGDSRRPFAAALTSGDTVWREAPSGI